jgi:transposase
MRAKAVVDVFGKLAAADMTLSRIIGAHPRGDAVYAKEALDRFKKIWDAYAEETDKNLFLLGQEMVDIANQYEKWIEVLLSKALTGEQMTAAEGQEGRMFRSAIWRMLPSLQLSDEHSLRIPVECSGQTCSTRDGGVMPQPYSVDLRERAVAAYKRGGRTLEEVAAEFSVSQKTLAHWLKLEAETGSLEPRPRGGGNFSPIQGELLERLNRQVRMRPDATLQEHLEALVAGTRVHTSRSAVMRALQRQRLVLKKSRS